MANLFGITETTVHVTWLPLAAADLEASDGSPIGVPLAGATVDLLDPALGLVPLGAPGEICVGGAGLARGYVGRADLTAARFVPDPGAAARGTPGARLYRSGDLARRRAGGGLEHLGRIDRQVKVRGFRVELAEIETALARHPAVAAAAVRLADLGGGDRRLVAYAVPDRRLAAPLHEQLRLQAAGELAAEDLLELPNGLAVAHLNRAETEFLYREIFAATSYLRHGVRLPPAATVFDVGANIGMFTLFAAAASQGALIYAFEPLPEICARLRTNLRLYGIAGRLFECGLAAAAGEAEFLYYPHASVLSGRHADPLQERAVVRAYLAGQPAAGGGAVDEMLAARLEARRVTCPLRTLSEVIRECGVEHIDLLKVDVEKSELEVLAGIDEADWRRVRQVVVEVHDGDGRLARVAALLGGHGFRVASEQDAALAGTGLATVYAVRPEATARELPAPPGAAALPASWTWSSSGRWEGALREALRLALPDYMLPAVLVPLAALPLTANGKLDAGALPEPARRRRGGERSGRLPQGDVERAIAAAWQEVLGVAEVGVDGNFFDLGGHSLLMVKVHALLRTRLGRRLSMIDLFRYPTVATLAAHLAAAPAAGEGAGQAVVEDAAAATNPAMAGKPAAETALATPHRPPPAVDLAGAPVGAVAVIGMSGRFPGAAGIDELWANLAAGVESIRFFTPAELAAAGVDAALAGGGDYVPARGVLDGAELFDAGFFGFPDREAEVLDPQQRLLLECAWEALEDAGYPPEGGPARIGVYAGMGRNTYGRRLEARPDLLEAVGDMQATMASLHDFVATRVSYKLDLRGPSLTVQSACSTSLVAVHLACRALLGGECDLALAGGAAVRVPQVAGHRYVEGGIGSPDGHCRPFDAAARGTVNGDGVGIVVLKRLDAARRDGDAIRAVIRGSAINNDGGRKVGYAAPGIDGQAAVIVAALAAAGIGAESIGYVEAHGTATPLGDPVEVAALSQAFAAHTGRRGYCALGSIKSNFGHLDAAAGIAGLIKTVLALERRQLPPSLHFTRANPQIDFAGSPFFVNTALRDWPAGAGPRRAAVSSFGAGGTNAHAVLEEAPPAAPAAPARGRRLLLLSARTPAALAAAGDRLRARLAAADAPELGDVAYTLQVGRRAFPYRRAVVAGSRQEAVERLAGAAAAPPPVSPGQVVAFLFPGQGEVGAGCTAGLYQGEPAYRERLDECAERLTPHLGLDLRRLLFPPPEMADAAAATLARSAFLQPALFAIEVSLAGLWQAWGVAPAAVAGHSLGELAAATVAGVVSLHDALALVAERGRLCDRLPPGVMLAVQQGEAALRPQVAALGGGLAIAAVNAPDLTVVAGAAEAVERLERALAGDGVSSLRLRLARPFHSPLAAPAVAAFARRLREVELRPAALPLVSSFTGTWLEDAEARDPDYWATQLLRPVRFADTLATLLAEPALLLLEVGPGVGLSCLARRRRRGDGTAPAAIASLEPEIGSTEEPADLLKALGALWCAGARIEWQAVHAGGRRRVHLPSYPFERRRFWIEDPPAGGAAGTAAAAAIATVPHAAGELASPAAAVGTVEIDGPVAGTAGFGELPGQVAGILSASSRAAAAVVARPIPVAGAAAAEAAPSAVAPTTDPWLSEVRTLFAAVLGESAAIPATASFLELGADSLVLIEASRAIERRFGVRIPFRRMLEELATPARLADYLAVTLPGALPAPAAAPLSAAVPQRGVVPPPPFGLPLTAGAVSSPGSISGPSGLVAPVSAVADPAVIVELAREHLRVMGQLLALLGAGPPPAAATPPAAAALSAVGPLPSAVMTAAAAPVVVAAAPAAAATIAASPAVPARDAAATPAAPVAAAAATAAAFEPAPYVPYQPLPVTAEGGHGLGEVQRRHVAALVARSVRRSPRSRQMAAEQRPYHADPRATAGWRPLWKDMVFPLVSSGGKGSHLRDVDGNDYVDFTMGFGVHLFGHSPDFVAQAIAEQLRDGVELGPRSPLAGEVARGICAATGHQRVAFCASGTEAVMTALRVVRAVTRRPKVAVFAGSFHGAFDGTLGRAAADAGAGAALPLAPGVLPGMVGDLLMLDYGSPRALDQLRAHAGDLAAVLVEPVQSRRPDLQPREFLHQLRALTRELGAALVFDEMVTGFRLHPAGAQGWFGVEADLATYGKVLGGGLPIGVVAGQAAFLDALDGGAWDYGDDSLPPAEQTFFACTYAQHPLALAAARAVLAHLAAAGPDLQRRLNARGARLAERLDAELEAAGLAARMAVCGSILRFLLPREASHGELLAFHLLEEGIFIGHGRPAFLSTAHSDEDLDRLVAAVGRCARRLRAAGFLAAAPATLPRPAAAPPPAQRPAVAAGQEAPGATAPLADLLPAAAPPPPPRSLPLTTAQEQLWVLGQLDRDAAVAYNHSLTLRLSGPLAVPALAQACQQLADRHEALRISFSPQGDEQLVHDHLPLPLQVVDAAGWPVAERDARNARGAPDTRGARDARDAAWSAAAAREPFDLTAGPLFRASLLRRGAADHLLVLTSHHIVVDGWSLGVLLRDLRVLYAACLAGEPAALPPPAGFSRYVAWQLERAAGPAGQAAESFWLDQYREPPAPLELPVDRLRPAERGYATDSVTRRLDPGLWQAVRAASARLGATPLVALLATFEALLYRLSGQQDLAVGIFAAGQAEMGEPDLVGFCVAVLPLRARLAAGTPYAEHLAGCGRRVLDALDHQSFPLGSLLRRLRPARGAHPPLVQVTFNFDRTGSFGLAGVAAETIVNPSGGSDFDLDLNLVEELSESPTTLTARCEFNAALWDRATVRRWLGHLETLLGALASTGGAAALPLADLDLLSGAERWQLLAELNDTGRPERPPHGLLARFAGQVATAPAAVAAAGGGASLTYRALDEAAERIARRLGAAGLAARAASTTSTTAGAAAEPRIALLAARDPSFLAALLAILKVGAVYLPLDPEHPPERLGLTLRGSRCAGVIAAGECAALLTAALAPLPPPERPRVLDLADLMAPADGPLAADFAHADDIAHVDGIAHGSDIAGIATADSEPAALAYVIHTSGSTGTPKGAMLHHAGLLNHLEAMIADLGLTRTDRLAQTASQCFDVSVWQLLAPLLAGGRVQLVDPEVAANPARMLDCLVDEGITVWETVPALLEAVLGVVEEAPRPPDLGRLRWLLVTGETVPPALCRRWHACYPAVPLVNAYGPAECSDDVSLQVLRRPPAAGETRVPIGRPLPGFQLHVVGAGGHLQPLGAAGELWVGGLGVGRGYLHDPARTAEVFTPDPFAERPGQRLYRTGDLARRRQDGALEFLGRRDHQIKLRGLRLELGEVESALRAHPDVAAAVAVVREVAAGDRCLVAYFVRRAGAAEAADLHPTTAALRAHLRTLLPASAVPSYLVPLPCLPLLASGKVDRRNLPEPSAMARPAVGEPLATPTERETAAVFAAVLGSEPFADDDFFALGGYSLKAVQVLARLRAAFGVELTLREFFAAPTVRGIAARLEECLFEKAAAAGELDALLDEIAATAAPRDAAVAGAAVEAP
ncbi:MAG TPA: amino acid adenylation domain-containing protein [Thermoanaerobaculia bacterium]|nr:amino acid adenylation domain-containing protein [Thermoanaerobaculia bacterium]